MASKPSRLDKMLRHSDQEIRENRFAMTAADIRLTAVWCMR